MTVEAGWYHAEGDPVGTVRRWNGYAWVGVPVRDPSSKVTSEDLGPGRVRITRGGALLGVLTLFVLSVLAALFAFVASRIFRDVDQIPVVAAADIPTDLPEGVSPQQQVLVREIPDYIDNLGQLSSLLLLGIIVTAIVFPLWLRSAAKAAQVRRYRRSSARKQRPRPSAGAIMFQVFVFGLFVPIWWALQAVIDEAAEGGKQNLFGAVSDTAMAASRGLGPGSKDISPIKIVVWWAFWLLPTVVLAGSWGWMFFSEPVPADTLRGIMQFTAVMMVLLVISLLCLMVTVGQISGRLSQESHTQPEGAVPRRI